MWDPVLAQQRQTVADLLQAKKLVLVYQMLLFGEPDFTNKHPFSTYPPDRVPLNLPVEAYLKSKL